MTNLSISYSEIERVKSELLKQLKNIYEKMYLQITSLSCILINLVNSSMTMPFSPLGLTA